MLVSSLHVGFYVRVVMPGAGHGTAIYVSFIVLFVFLWCFLIVFIYDDDAYVSSYLSQLEEMIGNLDRIRLE